MRHAATTAREGAHEDGAGGARRARERASIAFAGPRQRENSPRDGCKKGTHQSEKSDFSLGNAFFLQ
jgi:hypothetical protein